MRALTFTTALEYRSRYPVPTPASGEALVRVLQAGICATDLELTQGYMGFQGVLGHEFVGIVEDAPHSRLNGTRVVGEINAACRTCPVCRAGRPTHCPHRTTLGIDRRDGAFADFLCLPIDNLHPLPDTITDDQAVFAEPLAAACQILEQVPISPTDRVLVMGDGKLGLLCAQVLHHAPCQVTVLGRHQDKLRILADRGIQTCQAPDTVASGFDVVVEATGTPDGFALASASVRPRGVIVLKSTHRHHTSVDMTALVINEVKVVGSRCGPFRPALALLREQAVDVGPLLQKRFPIEQGREALACAAEPGMLKVVLDMSL